MTIESKRWLGHMQLEQINDEYLWPYDVISLNGFPNGFFHDPITHQGHLLDHSGCSVSLGTVFTSEATLSFRR